MKMLKFLESTQITGKCWAEAFTNGHTCFTLGLNGKVNILRTNKREAKVFLSPALAFSLQEWQQPEDWSQGIWLSDGSAYKFYHQQLEKLTENRELAGYLHNEE